jgi:hypothetical protein
MLMALGKKEVSPATSMQQLFQHEATILAGTTAHPHQHVLATTLIQPARNQ